ncbi:MAG: AmmeMemoRadiSam system radical SAM enzyme [Verrucomicrobia bacterium]|nr:AmmeMemoRadiSam system radical SAM enzyme [Verrucomicrobiota bacterium]
MRMDSENNISQTPQDDGNIPPDTPAPRKQITRRDAIRYGATGVACAAGGYAVVKYVVDAVRELTAEGVFKGDAPNDQVWELWRQRGWTHEGYHYLKLGRNVQCKICPNNCLMEPGDRSHCRNKINRDGTLYSLAFANPCSFHVDPVEKKPLFHFFPGSLSFSLATAGCVFRCLNCQNWEISQKKPEETKDPRGPELRLRPPVAGLSTGDVARLSMFQEDVVALAQWTKSTSISYTYSEPTAFYEYTYDTCKLARERKMKNILVTCGSMEEPPMRDLGQYLDAAHVDLKGFNEDIYWKLNAGRLQPVLNTLKTLKSMGIWFEIINLVVPTYTDKPDMIRRMCDWLAANIGPDHPIHFSRFHPQHKLQMLPLTPVEILLQAQSIARSAGLHYAYIGNVPGLRDAETTFCPNCKRAVIARDGFAITGYYLNAGKCGFCQTKIAGVWA